MAIPKSYRVIKHSRCGVCKFVGRRGNQGPGGNGSYEEYSYSVCDHPDNPPLTDNHTEFYENNVDPYLGICDFFKKEK